MCSVRDIVSIAYEHFLKVFESLPASYHSSYITVSSDSSGSERFAYEINSPLKSFGPSRTNFAITCPGNSGLSNLPFLWSARNFALSFSCIPG